MVLVRQQSREPPDEASQPHGVLKAPQRVLPGVAGQEPPANHKARAPGAGGRFAMLEGPAASCRPRVAAINPYVAQLTFTFIQILTWAIVARSLLSWFPVDQSSPLYQLLYRVTEPIIEPIRRVMPQTGMMDLSPLGAIIVLIIMGQLVLNLAQAA